MSRPLIIIPARMASKRFPGKPLAKISEISMLRRTAKIAAEIMDADYVIATDHADIEDHCKKHDLPVVMTHSNLASGSDRALAAAQLIRPDADIIVNLQGDAPFTDPAHIRGILDCLRDTADADIATPAVQLDWAALDQLITAKKTTPFSGTTVIEQNGRALWFSKTILPAIRNETHLRMAGPLSPVLRHIGLYGYRRDALGRFTDLPMSKYETLEGLEQLRALEAGFHIEIVKVLPGKISSPGIDTAEDLARAETLIEKYGDPFKS